MKFEALSGPTLLKRRLLTKTLRIVKLITILIFWACLQVSARGYAQKITLDEKSAPLEKIFAKIRQQAGFVFWYEDKLLQNARKVDIHVSNANLKEVLDLCFAGQSLTYEIIDNTIVVKAARQLPLEGGPSLSDTPAPPGDIHGHITDSLGSPLAGASVMIKGTGKIVVTDENGDFFFKAIAGDVTLLVTNIGYENLEWKLKGKTEIILEMKIRPSSLLDVVVNKGYYSERQRLSTGSVGIVTSKDIGSQPVSDPLMALEGRVPGLVVTQTSGLPGASLTVKIRGQNSLAQGSDPLYVIDGVPFAAGNSLINQIGSALGGVANNGGLSAFSSINPADIESIEVLKDADATSIYGSQGANGVILITTKKGKAGKLRLNASVYSGFSNVTRMMKLMNTQQYLTMRHEAFKNDGETPDINTAPDLFAWDTTRYTNLQKLLIGNTSKMTDAQASISGGSGNTSYLIGTGYHHQTPVFPGDLHDNRGSFNLNLIQSSADKKFTAALSTIYGSDNNNLIGADLTQSTNLPPNIPAFFDSAGDLKFQQGGVGYANPLAYTKQTYDAQTDNLVSSLSLSYRVLPGLTIKSSLGYNTMRVDETVRIPIETQDPANNPTGLSEIGNNLYKSWSLEPQINYNRTIGQGKLDVLVGGTWQEKTNKGSTITASGITSDAMLLFLPAAPNIYVYNSSTEYHYQAFFGRINYNWADKYIINLTGRRDGSSRFGPGKQFGNFGSAGAAWIFTNEPFFRPGSVLSFGKLRGSYGIAGNDQIGDYQFLDSWSITSNTYAGSPALRPARLFNPDYSWEINKKMEAALELGFFDDRILLSTAWYRNRVGNQLVQYKLPAQTGFSGVTQNFPAVIQNEGLEISVSAKNIQSKIFSWTTSFNISIARNKLLSFPGLATSSYASTYFLGKSLTTLERLHSLGVDPATGVYMFQTKSGPSLYPDYDLDVHQIGNLDPKFYGGMGNTLRYRQWTLDFFMEFKKQMGSNYKTTFSNYIPGTNVNQPAALLSRWQKPGDKTDIQRFTQDGNDPYAAIAAFAYSDGPYSDASYLRLKNVSLSYNISPAILRRAGIGELRFSLTGQNLLTITRYLGNDPENNNIYALPPLKTFTAGLQLTF